MSDMLNGKWTEIKGEIQKTWGNLTGDDLEKTKGDAKAIAGLLQQKYGLAKEDASTKLESIYGKFQQAKQDLTKTAADTAEKAKEDVRENVKQDYAKRN